MIKTWEGASWTSGGCQRRLDDVWGRCRSERGCPSPPRSTTTLRRPTPDTPRSRYPRSCWSKQRQEATTTKDRPSPSVPTLPSLTLWDTKKTRIVIEETELEIISRGSFSKGARLNTTPGLSQLTTQTLARVNLEITEYRKRIPQSLSRN